jgi:hypothetical protein
VKAVGESGVESVQVYFPGGEELLWFSAQLDGTFYPGAGLTDVPVTIDRVFSFTIASYCKNTTLFILDSRFLPTRQYYSHQADI